MGKGQRTDCYKPYKGKRKGHLDGIRRVPGRVEEVPIPKPPSYACGSQSMGRSCVSDADRLRDEALGPLQGKTHTAALVLSLNTARSS